MRLYYATCILIYLSISKSKIYDLKKCRGAGCPYAASWLIQINLYRKLSWYLPSTKMEEATFKAFDGAHNKYIFVHPDYYFVHHLSEYEHLLHKKYGFDYSKNQTKLMTDAAYQGECYNLHFDKNSEYFALIPFYGGLPPNVDSNLVVKSLGQGNSLVDPETKALQCMATLCSCLRYFGRVVIGVSRSADRDLILKTMQLLPGDLSDYIHIIHLSMAKPAHLPFHLLTWGQQYMKTINCNFQNDYLSAIPTTTTATNSISIYYNNKDNIPVSNDTNTHTNSNSNNNELYFHICTQNIRHIHAITVVEEFPARQNVTRPLKYVYYTESDQIVRFNDTDTFLAISSVLDDRSLIGSRRRAKNISSSPFDYMGDLNSWRECCTYGFILDWPASNVINASSSR